jgi:hypothetical protein
MGQLLASGGAEGRRIRAPEQVRGAWAGGSGRHAGLSVRPVTIAEVVA